ncbi:hypothetical protein SO802_034226 [Lithocarpus litseifolius]|uniref:Reverse transcriptase domain-containing protein n=1 Tax=Lithocarpus litseifolius TaxID=425828 RepID=A0AAW2BHH2_9ROSI
MALKLDRSKAYDRLEWGYMQQVLVKMGFHERWVKLMMECITSATYSVIINGERHGHIIPTGGLRQGDPLSLYLFLMCIEGLHGLISIAARDNEIRGVSICRAGPRLTHLFFADDNLIFHKAKDGECQKLLDLLAKVPSTASYVWKSIVRAIWSLDIPGNVRNFVWRSCRNSLPSKTNLMQRKRRLNQNCFVGLYGICGTIGTT